MDVWLSGCLSSEKGSVAVSSGHWIDLPSPFQHSESFLPALKTLLESSHTSFEQIKGIVTSIGPGSFTGLRIAVSSFKALAWAWGIPLVLINGEEARLKSWVLENLVFEKKGSKVSVVSHLSTGKILLSVFDKTDSDWVLSEERILLVEQLKTQLPVVDVVLVDSMSNREAFMNAHVYLWTLNATKLLTAFPKIKKYKTYSGVEELAIAAPHYTGSADFKITFFGE